MNKWRAGLILLPGLLSLALVACGGTGGREPEANNPPPDEGVTVEAAPPSEEPAKGDEEGPEALGGGFEWRRVGGIAGFCDVVTVVAGQKATVATCRTEPPDMLGDVALTADQAAQLDDLVSRLAPFEHKQSDPATADAMTITITFAGIGTARPMDEDMAEMEALALEVLRAVGEQ